MLLVDTSVWIDVFRKSRPVPIEAVGDIEEFVTCLPILQEVLQGFRDQPAYRTAREAMLAFPIVESPMRLDLVEEAVSLYRAGRRAGLTIRSSVDCLIAACALRHGLTVVHRDRDFPALARVSALKETRI